MGKSEISRRALLGATASATAAVGVAATGGPASGTGPHGSPRRPVLPIRASQPTRTELILLGTSGGPPPDYVRTGISSVLTVGGRNYVIDAGRSSVTNYLNAGLLFSRLDSIFITHLHADHIADYYNYFLLGGNVTNDSNDNLAGPVHVYGPGPAGGLPPAVQQPSPTIAPNDPTPGIKALTEKLTEGYAYSHNIFIRETAIRDVRTLIDAHDVLPPAKVKATFENTAPAMDPFTVMEDDRVRVTAVLVPHGPVFPSYAYRFDTDDGSVVFSGDTKASENVVRLARGADYLVHEVIDIEFYEQLGVPAPLLEHFKEGHTPTTVIGGLAERAHVKNLVLSHLVPSNPSLLSDAEYRRKCQVGFSGRVHVGNDQDRLVLKKRRR